MIVLEKGNRAKSSEVQTEYQIRVYTDPDKPDIVRDETTIHRFDLSQRFNCPGWVTAQLDSILREMGYSYIGKEEPSSQIELWAQGANAVANGHIIKSLEPVLNL